MPYIRNMPVSTMRALPGRRALQGFGDFTDETQCSAIPSGDPYRKPGNYCATPDGGITTFNADGSTYRSPGAIDPDPAHPAGSDSSIGSVIGKIGGAILGVLTNKPVLPTPGVPVPDTGMSTTTKIALAGGAVLAIALIARRR